MILLHLHDLLGFWIHTELIKYTPVKCDCELKGGVRGEFVQYTYRKYIYNFNCFVKVKTSLDIKIQSLK